MYVERAYVCICIEIYIPMYMLTTQTIVGTVSFFKNLLSDKEITKSCEFKSTIVRFCCLDI